MLIGITGGSSSGKTHVAKLIEQSLKQNNTNVVLISQDNFYKGLSDGDDEAEYNFDHPDAIDFDELIRVIISLKNNISCTIPIYSFEHHKRIGNIFVEPADIIIVDGILIFTHQSVRDLFDLKIFVEASAETRLVRRIKRDQEERGRSLESIFFQYMKFVKSSYENYIKPTRKYCDVTIHNETNNVYVGLDIICNYVLKNNVKQLQTFAFE
jgi:uridine kinase